MSGHHFSQGQDMDNTLVSRAVIDELLECMSSSVYRRWKEKYDSYKQENGFTDDSIGVFMEFIKELIKTYKTSTIWQAASCVNKFLR